MKRDVLQKQKDLKQLQEIRNLELKKFKDQQQFIIQEMDATIQELQAKTNAIEDQLNDVVFELESAETDKQLEVSHC